MCSIIKRELEFWEIYGNKGTIKNVSVQYTIYLCHVPKTIFI